MVCCELAVNFVFFFLFCFRRFLTLNRCVCVYIYIHHITLTHIGYCNVEASEKEEAYTKNRFAMIKWDKIFGDCFNAYACGVSI